MAIVLFRSMYETILFVAINRWQGRMTWIEHPRGFNNRI